MKQQIFGKQYKVGKKRNNDDTNSIMIVSFWPTQFLLAPPRNNLVEIILPEHVRMRPTLEPDDKKK